MLKLINHMYEFKPSWEGFNVFKNLEHELFYKDCLKKAPNDVYHQSLFYTLGILKDTRTNIDSLYDFKNKEILFEGLNQGWQTGGSKKVTRMAFNLFNGFVGVWDDQNIDDGINYSPYFIFDTSEAIYLMEAIKIRYPEYTSLKGGLS